ncbi:uncharacterized protein LOC131614745 [Vicia villosa]|uniref:uncharacterized protein LOC131614745 n=1 Tax=Vicia villosa TaxID=3911 RepID=UPI00273B78EC|nr:uncharacterized protein LOC131614745 [Vicia villosa]
MARPFECIADINDRKELWKIGVKVHQKWKVNIANKEHFEMVVVDKIGNDIHVIVPTAYKQAFDLDLDVNVTCTMSNFQVQPNDLMFKVTNHKFLLKFTGGTTTGDVGKHDIPAKVNSLTPFADIISGKWQRNVLCGMASKTSTASKKQKKTGSTSRQPRPYDSSRFLDFNQEARFRELSKQKIWSERKFEINQEGKIKEVAQIIATRKWDTLVEPPSYLNYDVIREFYANDLPFDEEPFTFTTMVRGRNLKFDQDTINEYFGNPFTLREGDKCEFTRHLKCHWDIDTISGSILLEGCNV